MPTDTPDDKSKPWQSFLSLLPTLITVAGLLVGVYEFNKGEADKVLQESKSLREKDRIDFNRQLWLERLQTYRSTAEAAGKIASELDTGKQFDADLQAFDAAYWGRMIFVEDRNAALAMGNFHDVVQDYHDKFTNAHAVRRAAADLGEKLQVSISTDPMATDLKRPTNFAKE